MTLYGGGVSTGFGRQSHDANQRGDAPRTRPGSRRLQQPDTRLFRSDGSRRLVAANLGCGATQRRALTQDDRARFPSARRPARRPATLRVRHAAPRHVARRHSDAGGGSEAMKTILTVDELGERPAFAQAGVQLVGLRRRRGRRRDGGVGGRQEPLSQPRHHGSQHAGNGWHYVHSIAAAAAGLPRGADRHADDRILTAA